MSEENIEMVRRVVDAFTRGDLDGVVAHAAPDLVYIPSGALPGAGGPVHGREAYKRYIGWLAEEFDEPRAEARSIRGVGNQVAVELVFSGRGKQSGVETHWTIWQVWTVEDGKFAHGRAFTSEEEALEAAGIRS